MLATFRLSYSHVIDGYQMIDAEAILIKQKPVTWMVRRQRRMNNDSRNNDEDGAKETADEYKLEKTAAFFTPCANSASVIIYHAAHEFLCIAPFHDV
jgi:hypothetical protein